MKYTTPPEKHFVFEEGSLDEKTAALVDELNNQTAHQMDLELVDFLKTCTDGAGSLDWKTATIRLLERNAELKEALRVLAAFMRQTSDFMDDAFSASVDGLVSNVPHDVKKKLVAMIHEMEAENRRKKQQENTKE